jgi:hypothetical protein
MTLMRLEEIPSMTEEGVDEDGALTLVAEADEEGLGAGSLIEVVGEAAIALVEAEDEMEEVTEEVMEEGAIGRGEVGATTGSSTTTWGVAVVAIGSSNNQIDRNRYHRLTQVLQAQMMQNLVNGARRTTVGTMPIKTVVLETTPSKTMVALVGEEAIGSNSITPTATFQMIAEIKVLS